jgi:hypothetical protein
MLGIDYTENLVHDNEMCLDLIDKLGWLEDVASMLDD